MNKKCAKCEKTVYPTEELKCLDKVWHKACFRCQSCNMTLNMKNYKGYDKMPYCNAHYPTTKFTAVADTPESRRIAENTKLQSNKDYHSEFEKSKDKFTSVALPAAMAQCIHSTKITSLNEYHSDFNKMKNKYTAVAVPADMVQHLQNSKNNEYHKSFEESKGKCMSVEKSLEMEQHILNTKNISLVDYHRDFEMMKNKYTQIADPVDLKRHHDNQLNISNVDYHRDFEKSKTKYTQIADTVDIRRHHDNQQIISNVCYHADFEKQKGKKTSVDMDPETERIRYNTQIQSAISYHGIRERKDEMEQKRPAEMLEAGRMHHHRAEPSKTVEHAPVKDNVNSPYSGKQTSNVVYDSKAGQDLRVRPDYDDDEEIQNGMGRRQPGSIADYDPMNDRFGSITGSYPAPPPQQQAYHQPPPQQSPPQQKYVPPPQSMPPPQQPPPQRPSDPYANKGMVCRAMYDYQAGDDDEVGFMDGDIIINCEPVDQGWMTGIVERTGQHGMLPSNYVERIN